MSENENSNTSDGDSIKVYIRVRPPAKHLSDVNNSTCLEVDKANRQIIMHSKPEPKVFTFDEVADIDTTQESVFESVGKKVIESCFDGYNGTIFAYGQTCSGKTFTMLGPGEHIDNFQHKMRGVIPRSFETLFHLINNERELRGDNVQFLCKCSFLEIYNEQLFDLLDPSCSILQIRENIKCGVFVHGLTEVSVADASEAYECLSNGWMNRTVGSTSMNRESSRSHAVFTIYIESKKLDDGVWNVRTSQLNLVDLAGSERQTHSKTDGLRLKEANLINQSLSTLGNVIMALVDITHGKTRHIPYRNSKLTFLLKDSLGGNAKTYIIGCVHPSSRCFGDTLSTLQFAARAKMIKNNAVINEDTHGSVVGLQAEIRRLKSMLTQYQSGDIPPGLSASQQVFPDKIAYSQTVDNVEKYKQYFIEAMCLRQEALTKNELLQDKCKHLREMLNRRDQAISQNKLIVKLRENALQRCEKLLKQNAQMTSDDKDEIILSLREEIRILEKRLAHHPEVIQCRLEMANLQAELKLLRAEKLRQSPDNNRLAELEGIIQQLSKEKEIKPNRRQSLQGTPQAAGQLAMAEKSKSQIAKLQAEIETLLQEFAAEREQFQQTIVEKESEIISLRKSKERLETNIQAHQIRNRVELECIEDTLKIITTPKKGRLFSSSFTDSDSDVLQIIPDDVSDERTEPLMEQIKKLQEELKIVNAQRDNLESQIVEQVQEVSRIESQKLLTQQLYNNEKAAWADKEKQLTAEVNQLTNKVQTLEEERVVLHGEVEDLRVMYEAIEKRCKEAKQQVNECNEQRQKEVGTLETKKVQMELRLKQLQRELEQSHEELVMLRQSEENCQATLDFTQEKLQQAEEKLVEASKEREELQVKLTAAEERLSQEIEKNHKLHHQLHDKGDQEKRLLESLSELEASQAEIQNLKEMISINDMDLSSMKQQLSDAAQQIDNLQTSSNEKSEMISSLTSQLSAKREQISEKERTVELLSKQLEEYTDANTRLVSENEQLAREKAELVDSHAEEIEHLGNEILKLKLKVDLQQEDFDQILEEKDELLQNLEHLNNENNQQMTRNEELTKTIEDLKEENASLSKTITSIRQAVDSYVNTKNTCEENESEIAALKTKCEELEKRSAQMLQAFDMVSQQREDLVSMISSLEEQLEAKNKRIQLLEDEVQDLRNKYNQYTEEVESWKEKANDLQNSLLRTKEEMSALITAEKQSQAEAAHVKAEMSELTDLIEQLKVEISDRDAEVTRLRETLELKQQQSEELQATCNEIRSLNNILEREANELREKCQKEAEEKARLAGNQNHSERIKYVAKINQERNELCQKYQQLVAEHEKLRLKYESIRTDRRTPVKARLADIGERQAATECSADIVLNGGHITPARQGIEQKRPNSVQKK